MEVAHRRFGHDQGDLKRPRDDPGMERRNTRGVRQGPCDAVSLHQPLGQQPLDRLTQQTAVDPAVVDGGDQGVDRHALQFGQFRREGRP